MAIPVFHKIFQAISQNHISLLCITARTQRGKKFEEIKLFASDLEYHTPILQFQSKNSVPCRTQSFHDFKLHTRKEKSTYAYMAFHPDKGNQYLMLVFPP